MLQTRISNSFPAPIKEKMKNYLMHAEKNKNKKSTNKGEEVIIAERVKMLYSRLAGMIFLAISVPYEDRLYQDGGSN